MHKGKLKSERWLIRNAKPVLWQILSLSFLGILMSYISVKFALASRDLLDFVTGGLGEGFYSCVIVIAVLLVLDISVQSIYNILSVRLDALYKNRLQKNLFSGVVASRLSSLGDYHTGEIINRLTSDVRVVSTNIIHLVPTVTILISGVAMSFWALFKLDASLGILCIALGPVIFISSILYGRRVKKLHKSCRESDGKVLSFMHESIKNLLVIKAFGKEKKFESVTASLQDENYRLNMKVGYTSLAVNILYFVALTAAYYFAVAWCAYKIHIGIMTVGSFVAIIQLVGSVQSPFKEISSALTSFFATCASAERLMEIEKLKKDYDSYLHITDFSGIEVSSVSFGYGEENVLENATFSIEKGDIVAVTGSSGMGKSTLLKLLLGIYPVSGGNMYIYNNVEKIPVGANTRCAFCYVPQGNMIISGTVGDNIAFFDENADESKIREAARLACILDYIDSLPDGMNTILGEGGAGLSEGQIQRLAIARAIYAGSPVILLDEATSALDEETEAKILANIKSLEDKTCIIITHRPQALNIANKRINIENAAVEVTRTTV